MSKLPSPSWLNLPEVIAWLEERGISQADAKSNLPRAFRDGHIQTRGRGRGYIGHNIKTPLHGVDWDQAAIAWEENSFETPSKHGVWEHIADVDVSRDDLSRWIGEDEGDSSNTDPVKKSGGRKPQYDWEAFYVEIAVKADLDSLPETQAELEKAMASWCLDNWEKRPAESTIRSKIAPIYQHSRRLQGR